MEEALAVAAVFVISYLIGKIAVVMYTEVMSFAFSNVWQTM
jgi:hypothetical protein